MKVWELEKLYQQEAASEEILKAYEEIGYTSANEDETMLHLACKYGDDAAVEVLLKNGVEVDATSKSGKTALHALADLDDRYKEYPEKQIRHCADLLIDAGASVMKRMDDHRGDTPITMAGRTGRYEIIESALAHDKKISRTNQDGDNVLHCVASYYSMTSNDRIKKNMQRLAKDVVDSGFDTSEKNGIGKTPLEVAAEKNAKEIAAILEGKSADDQTGGMNFFQALQTMDVNAVTAIAKEGQDLNQEADEGKWIGRTPLSIACSYMNLEMVDAMLAAGANPNFKNAKGETCMNALLTSNRLEGMTPFQYRKEKDLCKDLLKKLLDAGMEKDGTINDASDTMAIAASRMARRSGEMDYIMVQELLKCGCNFDLSNLEGETPLMLICKQGERGMGDLQVSVLEKGVDVNLCDKNGNTALHYAANNSDPHTGKEMAEMLFEFDFKNVEASNNDGKTALEIATDQNNEPLVKVILENS